MSGRVSPWLGGHLGVPGAVGFCTWLSFSPSPSCLALLLSPSPHRSSLLWPPLAGVPGGSPRLVDGGRAPREGSMARLVLSRLAGCSRWAEQVEAQQEDST